MTETRKLRQVGSAYCREYKTDAKFFVQDEHPSGLRQLIVQYEKGRSEFAAAIPADWTEEDVQSLILWPMKDPNSKYPAWEIPAQAYGSPKLFRFWAGEKS
jgi:hypothetical protein